MSKTLGLIKIKEDFDCDSIISVTKTKAPIRTRRTINTNSYIRKQHSPKSIKLSNETNIKVKQVSPVQDYKNVEIK